jgi:thymidylate synthase
MNNLDKQYTDLLQDILDNGIQKGDRTGTGTLSLFGRQIRHKMSDGFPLITTKKMFFKGIVTELLWFLKGDTNIKFLVDNGTSIWNGDAYKNYLKHYDDEYNEEQKKKQESPMAWMSQELVNIRPYTKEEFINKIKTDDEFAKKWGDLGPIYGKQWRSWRTGRIRNISGEKWNGYEHIFIDQISNLINDLKTNPDSRRLMVNAWNVGELDSMVLPPCHYGFQVYTRELNHEELRSRYPKLKEAYDIKSMYIKNMEYENAAKARDVEKQIIETLPTRAISLMWNQRSVDTFLGLPFNIASYGLLLEIIAKAVNMVPDELIGNLGDVHLYSNHIEQAKEQIGREFTQEEIQEHLQESGMDTLMYEARMKYISKLPKRTREPFPLPILNINTEFWPYESGECGVGPLDAVKVFESFKDDNFCKCLLEEDIQLSNYQSHPSIKAPLSN